MNFYLNTLSSLPITMAEPFTVTWTAPSNIALVKYWGKHGKQLPCNPSLSFALKESTTSTTITFSPSKELKVWLEFEGEKNEAFRARIERFFKGLGEVTHFFKNLDIRISSSNTFPHSAGIASSASSLASVALCVSSLIYRLTEKEVDDNFYRLASYFARLGSGSAARSVYGGYCVWGHTSLLSSNDEFGVQHKQYNPIFNEMNDAIILVSESEKRISSSIGHQLMNKNPFAEIRYANAHKNLSKIVDAMKTGNLSLFFNTVEQEALELHAMMMVSEPPYLLFEPNTLEVIYKIREFRQQKGIDLGFTIDAGPNIHLLYLQRDEADVVPFIESLRKYCERGNIIFDRIGDGPELKKG